MKKNKVIGISLLVALSFSGLQAADYKMKEYKHQPKYSKRMSEKYFYPGLSL